MLQVDPFSHNWTNYTKCIQVSLIIPGRRYRGSYWCAIVLRTSHVVSSIASVLRLNTSPKVSSLGKIDVGKKGGRRGPRVRVGTASPPHPNGFGFAACREEGAVLAKGDLEEGK